MSKLSETEVLLSDVNLYGYITREKLRSLYYQNGDWSRALELAKKAQEIFRVVPDNDGEGRTQAPKRRGG